MAACCPLGGIVVGRCRRFSSISTMRLSGACQRPRCRHQPHGGASDIRVAAQAIHWDRDKLEVESVLYSPFPASAAYRYGNEGRVVHLRARWSRATEAAAGERSVRAATRARRRGPRKAHGGVLYDRFFAERSPRFSAAPCGAPHRPRAPVTRHRVLRDIVAQWANVEDVLTRTEKRAELACLIDRAWDTYQNERGAVRP